MTTTSSICDINYDILSLICGTIDDEYVCGRAYNRPSVLAFSETCKLLRSIAAPIIFSKLVIWDWDSFCETSQMMRTCENARRFTRCAESEKWMWHRPASNTASQDIASRTYHRETSTSFS